MKSPVTPLIEGWIIKMIYRRCPVLYEGSKTIYKVNSSYESAGKIYI